MNKIGVITHFYKSENFGGILQSYALCEVINDLDVQVEQISYDFKQNFNNGSNKNVKTNYIKKVKSYLINKILSYRAKKIQKDKIKHEVDSITKRKFEEFISKYIPHSKEVYSNENISTCVENYDVFITGSDQVWNPIFYRPAFLLEFAPSTKTKISYSASIARDSLSQNDLSRFKNALGDFKAISVREESAIGLIKEVCPVEPIVTLDPTLLLKDKWNDVCADRLVQEKYIFCYFLGENKEERKAVKRFAKEKGLRIVFPCYASKISLTYHRKFGDIKLYGVSPDEFLSLIKYAEYVFTDSFHAVVFSNVFKKQYFVFDRNKKGDMNSRIIDITNLFNQQERYVRNSIANKFSYVKSLDEIDYSKENPRFEELYEKSIKFIEESLGV